MDRPRALWMAFLAVWAFTLLAYGGVTVPCTAAAAAAMALLTLAAGRLIPQPARLSKAGLVFLAASGALFAIQLLPVAPLFFPETQGWRARHGVGSAWPATADTFRTVLALAQFSLYALSALMIVRLRQAGLGASTVLKGAIALLLLEAAYGIVQSFANLKEIPFYGPRASPDSASGTLVGRNNFAGLMATGFVLAVALAWGRFSWPHRRSGDEGKPRWIRRLESGAPWALAAALFAVAILLSHSRGGALAALGGAILLPFVHRGRASVAGAAAVVLIAAGAVAVTGLGPLLERFGVLDPYDLTADARWKIVTTTAAGAARQPILGFGFGTHPVAYHPYQPPSLAGQVHHAHNEYMNLFFEAGAVGVLLFVGALAFWFARAWRAQRPLPSPDRLLVTAAIAGVASTALHSFVDFDLRIPSNGILFAALIGLGAAATRSGAPRPKLALTLALVSLAAVASLGAGIDPVRLLDQGHGPDTDRMERLTRRVLGLSPYEYRAAWHLSWVAARKGDKAGELDWIERSADLWPAHAGTQRAAGLKLWVAGDRRAEKCFHRLFEQSPSQVVSVLEEIWAADDRGPEAVERLIPPIPAVVTAYATFLVREGDWPRAVKVFEKGVPPAADHARLYDQFAAALDAVGQWGVEATILDRRLEVKSDAPAYAASARAWLRLGATDLALQRAELAGRIDLASAEWPALLGDVFRARGELLKARDAYSASIEKAPMELAYRQSRAWTYLELKMYEPAADDFQVALRSKPRERSLVLGLAQSLSGAGKSTRARFLLDEYLQKAPDDAAMRQVRDSLPP